MITATNSLGQSTRQVQLTILPLPPGIVGTFHGSIGRITETEGADLAPWPRAVLGGRLEFTITASGLCSGKVLNGGPALSFTAQVRREAGACILRADIFQGAGLAFLNLRLQFAPEMNTASGIAYSGPSWEVAVSAWRNVWSTVNPAGAYAGRYNFVMSSEMSHSYNVPGGNGFGSCVVPASGQFPITGRLPDGAPLLSSTFLGPQGQVLLFQALYAQPGTLKGALQITPGSEFGGLATVAAMANLTWYKPEQTSATERSYREGIILQRLQLWGGLYLPPAQGEIILGVTARPDNAALAFDGGALSDSSPDPGVTFGLTPTSVVMPTGGGNAGHVILNVKTATGEFNGSFTVTDPNPSGLGTITRTGRFFGLFTGSGPQDSGSGFFILPALPDSSGSPPTTLSTSPVLTGRVDLTSS